MSPFQGILAGYALLFVSAAFALALVPLARFITRRAEQTQAISPQRRAELYPLEHGFLAEFLGALFSLAFMFERPLTARGWPFVEYLARVAPLFFFLLCVYRFSRSVWLLRHLPASDSAARSFVRSTLISSGAAGVIVAFVLLAIVQ